MNQRWHTGRDRYRPPGEVINTREYDVEPIASDSVARDFVCRHHYSASFPAARWRHGLYRSGELVGVAVFSVPMSKAVITGTFKGLEFNDGVELGRFVLLDEVPGNGETWMLGRCFDLLKREGIAGVVSFSDPMPRTNECGETVFGGHLGTIYQAFNGRYLGRGRKRALRMLPDGRVLSERSISKVYAMARGEDTRKTSGWMGVVEQMMRYGAPGHEGDLKGWMDWCLANLTRVVKHPGNHRYAWGLLKSVRKALPLGMAYPKQREC
jgi:hypothetical protein